MKIELNNSKIQNSFAINYAHNSSDIRTCFHIHSGSESEYKLELRSAEAKIINIIVLPKHTRARWFFFKNNHLSSANEWFASK